MKDRKTIVACGTAARSHELPARVRATFRVTQEIPRLDQAGQPVGREVIVHDETSVERDALQSFHRLRAAGLPVLVTRWQIYRVQIEPREPHIIERFAFVEAFSPEDACIRIATASACFDNMLVSDVRERVNAKSFEECMDEGVSADLELRLFEVEWTEGRVTQWVQEPMFLLSKPSELTLKWAGLQTLTCQ
jgi:hypothetical protein